MRITLRYGPAEREIEVADGMTPGDILREMKLHPDAHLVVRDNAPIPLDGPLRDGDAIKIVKVASGG